MVALKRAGPIGSRKPRPMLAISMERRRRILQLDLEGMLRTEIAESLGVHEQTVRNYLRKAGRVPPPPTHPSFEKFTGEGSQAKNEPPRAHLTKAKSAVSAGADQLPARVVAGLGARLFSLRGQASLSQEYIAKRLSLPLKEISAAEVYSRASVDLVRRLALFFRVDFDVLMGWRK